MDTSIFTASEAAAPAASPTQAQMGMMRVEECASCVAEIGFPAITRFVTSLGTSALKGIV